MAICTRHATRYANWYGMTVDTRNRSMAVVRIRRRGVDGANAGDAALRLSSFRNHAGLTLTRAYKILKTCVRVRVA